VGVIQYHMGGGLRRPSGGEIRGRTRGGDCRILVGYLMEERLGSFVGSLHK